MKLLIACGGSGGHIFPGLALAHEISKDHSSDILLVCSTRPLDSDILGKSRYKFKAINCEPFIFTLNPFRVMLCGMRLLTGIRQSIRLIGEFKPDVVTAFGGFVTVPVVLAAWLLRRPVLIHEQNVVAGLANRFVSPFSRRIAVSFEDTKKYFNKRKVVKVGNPVRENTLNLDREHGRRRFGLDRDRFTLFVLGGSQGAASLNSAVRDAITSMEHQKKRGLQVIHITGKSGYEEMQRAYKRDDVKASIHIFLDEIEAAYEASDLAIARAGATTIAELTFFGRPSILVPYPQKRVHQSENALHLSEGGAAIRIDEKDLSAEGLKDTILGLLNDRKRLDSMSANAKRLGNAQASKLLADEVISLSRGIRC